MPCPVLTINYADADAERMAEALDEIADGILVHFDPRTVPERDADRVAALIPDARIADGYVHRDALPGVYDFDLLDGATDMRHNVLLVGPTGSSKTTLFRAYAAARQLPLAIIECSANMDPKSVLGRMTIDQETGRPTWIDGPLMLVIRYGGVAAVRRGQPRPPEGDGRVPRGHVGHASHRPERQRRDCPRWPRRYRRGTARAHRCGDQPDVTYTGTSRLNQAFRNRFAIPVKWPYLREVEAQMVTSSTTLLDFADSVR